MICKKRRYLVYDSNNDYELRIDEAEATLAAAEVILKYQKQMLEVF
jgi:hypothetical protein